MDFFELLANHHLDSQSRWSKVKDKVETDPRYKAVDSSSQREDLFKQYIEKIAKVCVTFGSVSLDVLLVMLLLMWDVSKTDSGAFVPYFRDFCTIASLKHPAGQLDS